LGIKTDIQCPACKTVFKVDISKIPEKGCHANCRKCKERFLISRPAQPSDAPVSSSAKKVKPTPAVRPKKKPPSVNRAPIAEATAADSVPVAEATPDDSASLEKWTLDDSDPFAESTAAAHAPTDEWTLDDSDPFAQAAAAAHAPTDEWTLDGSTSIEDWAVDDSAPVEEEALADSPPIAEATAAVKAPMAKAAPAVDTAAKKNSPAPAAKPGQNKIKNYLLIGSLVGLVLLAGIGAVFFLMQKFDFRVTAKDSGLTSRDENARNMAPPAAVSPKPATVTVTATATAANENSSAAGNMDVDIGDLFNQVNPAVATVLTYDSGNNIFMQGSGFFISQDGDFITNYHVLKGA